MMPPHCAENSLDRDGRRRACALEAGHDGDHMDWQARTWEPATVALPRIRDTWGSTHRIAILPSGMWLATTYDHRAAWRTETEYTAEQLEESLQRHNPIPTPRNGANA